MTPDTSSRRRSPAAAALLTLLCLAIVLAAPPGARAAGSPNISATTSSSSVLFGAPSTVTLNASNPALQPYGYNLSFRAVLPVNVSYVAGSASPAPTTVLAGQPAAGQTTLIWSNVSDLSPNSSNGVSFQVNHSQAAFTIGGSFAITGEASINTDPRNVTQFNATTGVPVPASFTGSATSTGTQSITAIKVTKTGGGSLLRGVHDHQTTYTTTTSNNLVNQTTGVVLTDYLPAGIEYLGCGGAGADHTTDAATNPGSTEEYPGSGPIVVPVVAGCVAPSSVDTVTTDPDGAGPLPTGTYTRLQWNLGTLAAGQVVNRPYRVAIPLRENTDTRWPNGRPTAASGDQAANLDNNSGPETDDEQPLTNDASAAGSYNGVTPVSDATTMTTIAEDLLQGKSRSSGSLVQGAITTWTLTFATGEYRYSEDVTVTDTLPNAYCPLGPVNFTTGNSPSDSQCDPTGAQPSVPYSSATENADGTFTIVWTPASMPQLDARDGQRLVVDHVPDADAHELPDELRRRGADPRARQRQQRRDARRRRAAALHRAGRRGLLADRPAHRPRQPGPAARHRRGDRRADRAAADDRQADRAVGDELRDGDVHQRHPDLRPRRPHLLAAERRLPRRRRHRIAHRQRLPPADRGLRGRVGHRDAREHGQLDVRRLRRRAGRADLEPHRRHRARRAARSSSTPSRASCSRPASSPPGRSRATS